MNASDLPGYAPAFGFALFGAPLVVAAMRRAGRVMPARRAPAFRWSSGEALLVVAVPFVTIAGLALLAVLLGWGPSEAVTQAPGEPAPESAEPSGSEVLRGMIGTQLILGAAGALAILLAARRRDGLASLGLVARPPRGAFGVVLLVYLPGFFLCAGIGIAWAHLARAFGWEERQEILRMILALERGEILVAALVAVLIGPLIEELLFRGFLQAWLGQWLGERTALFLTSAVFARLHGMAGLPVLFLLSLFLGWLQQRSRCLWVPWSAHALNNLVTLVLALSVPSG